MLPNEMKQLLADTFPWTTQYPTLVEKAIGWIEDGIPPDELIQKLRNTPEHKAHFPGFFDESGRMRFTNEADYNTKFQDWVGVMKRHGAPGKDYNDRQDWAAFLEVGIVTEELDRRWNLHDTLKASSRDIIDAFYVYAGLEVNEDDLYRAIVNPDRMNVLVSEYNARSALSPADWDQWLQRATEVSVTHAIDQLQSMVSAGYASQTAVDELRAMDPSEARTMIDSLAQEMLFGTETPTPSGSIQTLSALTQAFQHSVIGSAATVSGLSITEDRELLRQAVQAGVDRSTALQAYSTIAARGSEFNAFARRAGLGPLDRGDLEEALLLNSGPAADRLRKAVAAEQAQGMAGGGFRFEQSRSGMIRQRGFRPLGA